MFERFSRNTAIASAGAVLAALGVGSVALAQSSGSPSTTHTSAAVKKAETPGAESNAPGNSATDGDNVQYTAPGDPDAKQAGSEAPGNDGPGGHADEANGGNANADHQFQGNE
jgi:hypothetical protein